MMTVSGTIRAIEASVDPLSADVGIIRNGDALWLYDVGNGEKSLAGFTECDGIVLSHFHADHTGNLDRYRPQGLYLSRETYRHVQRGTVVQSELTIGNMRIFPLPSSHAKGCLGLETESHAFVGDALYGRVRDGCLTYNAQLLREEITVLKALRAPWLLVSHYPGLIRSKNEVLEELSAIYGMREKNRSEITVRREAWE